MAGTPVLDVPRLLAQARNPAWVNNLNAPPGGILEQRYVQAMTNEDDFGEIQTVQPRQIRHKNKMQPRCDILQHNHASKQDYERDIQAAN